MPRVIEDFDVDDLYRRHMAGESIKKASERLGISRKTLADRLIEAGYTPRNRSQAMFVRMASTGADERKRLCAAAHDAVRGKRQTDEHRIKYAKTRELVARPTGAEREMLDMLTARGLACVPQKAIGKYNVDIAITEPPVAVEVFGGHWHSSGRHAARHAERTKHVLDAGWSLVVVWVSRDYPVSANAVDQIVALADSVRAGESVGCQYLVIRGDGKRPATGKVEANGWPSVEGLERRDNANGQYLSVWK